jgi:hypothetical protein
MILHAARLVVPAVSAVVMTTASRDMPRIRPRIPRGDGGDSKRPDEIAGIVGGGEEASLGCVEVGGHFHRGQNRGVGKTPNTH